MEGLRGTSTPGALPRFSGSLAPFPGPRLAASLASPRLAYGFERSFGFLSVPEEGTEESFAMTVDRTVKALLAAVLLALLALLVQNALRDVGLPDAARPTSLPAPGAPGVGREEPARSTPGDTPQLSLQRFGGALANAELPAEIRSWAATQVGRIRTPEAVEALIAVLEDAEIEVVRAAVDALAQQDDPRASDALVGLRAHPDPWVSRRVGEALAPSGNAYPTPSSRRETR